MRFPMGWRIVGAFWAIVVMLHPQTAHAQVDSQKSKMDLICLADHPAIVEGGITRLRAWAIAPDGTRIAQSVSFAWQATEGSIQGSSSEVQWNLEKTAIKDGELHKKVTATVKAVAIGVGDATCAVDVFIGKNQPDDPIKRDGEIRGLRSARRYLLPNEKEEAGFGLYSYLLFPARPGSEEEKVRYLKTLEACLQKMETVEDHISRHKRRSELNATHIPVKTRPKDGKVLADWAANVLDVYDYTAAQHLLDKLDKPYQRGPYVVSVVNAPLSGQTEAVQEYLLQDFTGKVPELISQVFDRFTSRAAQQTKWIADDSFRSFWLDLRNLAAIVGNAVPDVVGRTMIIWKQANQTQ